MRNQRFVVSAPTRADLAGGTLDLWPLYCFIGSSKTINVAIDLRAICTFECLSHSTPLIEVQNNDGVSFSFTQPQLGGALDSVPKEIRFPVAVISRYFSQNLITENFHLKIRLETQAPVGSGLGGSSTLCVALLKGLGHLTGQFQGEDWQWRIMEWARDVEAEYLKTPTGTQDYLGAIFGSLSCFGYELGKLTHQTYRQKVVEELDSRMLVLFSGEMHHSGLSNWDVFKKAVERDEKVVSGLTSIHGLAESLHQELLNAQVDWRRVGFLMSEEWRIRKTTLGVNTERLDEMIQFLTSKKIDGVKVCGAAQGGSLMVLVEPSRKNEMAEICRNHKIKVLPTQVASSGVRVQPLPL
jgi:D-glycero-alpha-D-manno-heptose-7-phosphate kinase